MKLDEGLDDVLNILPAKEIYLQGNEHALLLLHSFTRHTRDVKKVATSLHSQGYTCYAPLYRGHGTHPEQLLHYQVDDWWQKCITGKN